MDLEGKSFFSRGIDIRNSNNLTFSNVDIEDFIKGIYAYNSENISFKNLKLTQVGPNYGRGSLAFFAEVGLPLADIGLAGVSLIIGAGLGGASQTDVTTNIELNNVRNVDLEYLAVTTPSYEGIKILNNSENVIIKKYIGKYMYKPLILDGVTNAYLEDLNFDNYDNPAAAAFFLINGRIDLGLKGQLLLSLLSGTIKLIFLPQFFYYTPTAVSIINSKNITVKKADIRSFFTGIAIEGSKSVFLEDVPMDLVVGSGYSKYEVKLNLDIKVLGLLSYSFTQTLFSLSYQKPLSDIASALSKLFETLTKNLTNVLNNKSKEILEAIRNATGTIGEGILYLGLLLLNSTKTLGLVCKDYIKKLLRLIELGEDPYERAYSYPVDIRISKIRERYSSALFDF
jgi:hypothetical protein